MENTIQTTAVPESPAGTLPVSGCQKTAGVLIVTASVINLLGTLSGPMTIGMMLAAVAEVLSIVAFTMLVFRSSGRQMRMMTSLLLLSGILFLAVNLLYSAASVNKVTYAYLMSIVSVLVILLQMYAVSVMARVDETVPKENFVMIQLWLTASLISASVKAAVSAVDGIYIISFSIFDGIFGIMAGVSWKRIARTRLFAGKGQTFETVSYSPLNRFFGGPFVCAAAAVLLVVVLTFLM